MRCCCCLLLLCLVDSESSFSLATITQSGWLTICCCCYCCSCCMVVAAVAVVACNSTHTFTLMHRASRLSHRASLVLCISFAASFFNQIVNRLSLVEPPLHSLPPPVSPSATSFVPCQAEASDLLFMANKLQTLHWNFFISLLPVERPCPAHHTRFPLSLENEDTLNLILCKLQKQMRMCRRRDNPRNFKIYNS